MLTKALFTFLLFLITTLSITPAYGGESRDVRVPHNIATEIEQLAGLVPLGAKSTFDPGRVSALLDFVASRENDGNAYYADQMEGMDSAYDEFDVETTLHRMLSYAFNPDIPSHLFRPSSTRLSGWVEVDGEKKEMPKLWEHLSDLSKPIVVRGVEHEEITPDVNTGAYYGYDLDKTLILFRHKGNNVFIVLSRQKGVSDVGKKGVVVGSDEGWDYFYSGEKGLTKRGLGWVDSRIYKSLAISIYYEMGGPKPFVRCGTFKWLSAGWSGLNVVKREHIRKGLNRYAKDFKEIIEDSHLPGPEELARMSSLFKNMPKEERKKRTAPLLKFFINRSSSDDSLSRKDFSELIKSGEYFARMSGEQLEGVLALEQMKCILDRGCKTPSIRESHAP